MLNPTETFIPQGFTVIIIAIAIFKMYDYLTTRYKKFNKMIVSKPILLVKDGKILEDSMMKARISEDEFESYLRLSGTDDISDIKLSYLEINGQVLSKEGELMKSLPKINIKYIFQKFVSSFLIC
jgi:uncharacterized membrane protein YcaP (DUF421 family)